MQIVLIRHAHSEANAKGILSGRTPDVHLSDKGTKQSLDLILRLGKIRIAALHTSPMERCKETITPWWENVGALNNRGVELVEDSKLIEIDYGSWSGKKLSVLSRNALWSTVQNKPSAMYFPLGESMAGMQVRAMQAVHEAEKTRRKGAVLLISHGDVIKAIVASALGMHLDDFQRIVIDPASITILEFNHSKPRLTLLNDSRSHVQEIIDAPMRRRNLLGGGAGK